MNKQVQTEDLPRERLKRYGIKSLSNQELTALILATGTKQRSVFELSSNLMNAMSGGLEELDQMTLESLMAINGIGEGKACQILASVELGRRVYDAKQHQMTQIINPSDVAAQVMSELRYKKQEHFLIMLLDTKNQLLGIETISIGTLNASLVHPREVFNKAVRRSAHGIILIHNHPSGRPEPSQEDLLLTKRLVESGKIIGIAVLDHVIIGDGEFYSLKSQGQI